MSPTFWLYTTSIAGAVFICFATGLTFNDIATYGFVWWRGVLLMMDGAALATFALCAAFDWRQRRTHDYYHDKLDEVVEVAPRAVATMLADLRERGLIPDNVRFVGPGSDDKPPPDKLN